MQHYRPIRFNEFLKKGLVFSKDIYGVWHNGDIEYIASHCILLDMAFEHGYLELIPEDPVDSSIKIGDKVVMKNYYYSVVFEIEKEDREILDSGGNGWRLIDLRHCTPDEIAKYFR